MTELEAIRQFVEMERRSKPEHVCGTAIECFDRLLRIIDEHHEKYDKIFWAISHEDKPCPVCKERV